MALSMGFKIAGQYVRDPVAVVIATCVFLALNNFHQRLIPVILVSGPVAMAWYWPRRGRVEARP